MKKGEIEKMQEHNYHLFSIPIYTTSKKNFLKKYDSFLEKQIPDYLPAQQRCQTKIDLQQYVYSDMRVWQYNQIIGYIHVSINHQDIDFELYMPTERKRYRCFTKQKSFVDNWNVIGYHFYIGNKTNMQIINEIRDWLINIAKEDNLKHRYVDMSTFDNIADYIDIKKIIEDLKHR